MKKLHVRISEIAQKKLIEILDHLEFEWSVKSRKKFLSRFEDKVKQVRKHPNSCKQSREFPGIYVCVVEKHTSFIYRHDDEYLDIILVFSNQQNPKSISQEIGKHST